MTTYHDNLRDEANGWYQDECDRIQASLVARLAEAMRDEIIPSQPIRYAWEICHVCHGSGGHSRRLGVIDPERLYDEDFSQAYFRGDYDSRCERCHGSGKVSEIDTDALSPEARAWIDEYLASAYESAADVRAERMAGC